MTNLLRILLRILLRPWRPQIEQAQAMPPVPDPDPGPEYQQAMAEARAAKARAERIIATYTEPKRISTTRPA